MKGLYIHIPFCKTKCPYCNFYSVTNYDNSIVNQYLNSCINQLKILDNKNFDTIYIGGGTPSSIPAKILNKFINNILNEINFSNQEFTIEANPETVTDDFITFLKNQPVSRVSLGVQSLEKSVLKLLGRIHGVKKVFESVDKLKKIDINLNLDIIFDIPNVENTKIFNTAKQIVALEPSHISAYSYTYEDRMYLEPFNSDNSQYNEIERFFKENRYNKYEISNFARKGHESKHNILYWSMDEYIGIGASAHSMIYDNENYRIRYSKLNSIKEYINNPYIFDIYEKLDKKTMLNETIIFGLRMIKGINIENIEKRFGKIPINLLNNIENFVKNGLLEWKDKNLKTTSKGQLLLDSLSSSLLV